MSMVLFDVPGPKARVRHKIMAVVGIAAVAAALVYVVMRFIVTDQFTARRLDWINYKQIQLSLVEAIGNTLTAFVAGAALALVFGAIFAAARLSDHGWVRAPAAVIVEVFRAIPLVIMMFFFYYGLPVAGVKLSAFTAVVISLMLYNGSVLAEIFRAGINSLPKGQSEAAYALGMRKTQVMTFVLLPQALRAMLPTIISQLVVLLKDTALGFLITFEELLRWGTRIGGDAVNFGRPMIPVMIVVALIYIGLCLLLSWFATYLEKRNRRNKKVIKTDNPDVEKPVLMDASAAG
ncbi:amino acid ABC transporter permease [Lentzea flaviverrucosa]|uniref:Glutamate transport system permease protein n=1 Tax=Lentzea flaviverrucosa TaxID=200379 RepID=A0A1H9XX13_9PSEU|nr:amino acid ABC transporter permease [Lentzea flaviverrucosa]RDI17488.1 amino acid ABC transporter membrane protein 2 (PAAT family) [Lentzea flaviverrucosa]SES50644.1 glutamate transport system permease protein [Lentzea flaviverrucosa]